MEKSSAAIPNDKWNFHAHNLLYCQFSVKYKENDSGRYNCSIWKLPWRIIINNFQYWIRVAVLNYELLSELCYNTRQGQEIPLLNMKSAMENHHQQPSMLEKTCWISNVSCCQNIIQCRWLRYIPLLNIRSTMENHHHQFPILDKNCCVNYELLSELC